MSERDELELISKGIWAKEDKMRAWEWCEKNLELSGSTPLKGAYRTNYTPYVKGVLDALEDWKTQTIVLAWGSQTAKTTTLMAWLCWRITKHPSPTLWVMPTESLARSFSETRLQPMFRTCKPMAVEMPENPDKFKLLEMHFKNCVFNLIGSNSPASVASRPVEVVLCDELDKFAPATAKEASAFSLALERTKAFPRRKHVLTSTPTLLNGDVWQQYLAGTQEKYFVPCPHCNHKQELVFTQVKWDEKAKKVDGKWDYKAVKASAHYQCISCKGIINDGHKTKMLRAGEWVATNAENAEPARRSFHLNSIYSPSITFSDCATKFLTEKHFLQGLQNFVNGWLALPWEDQFSEEDSTIINEGNFLKKQAWDKEAIRVCAIDRQIDELWYVVRAYSAEGASRLIDEGRVRTIEDMAEKLKSLNVDFRFVAMDCGYETQDTQRVCAKYGWTSMKGEGREYYLIEDGGRRIKAVHSSFQLTDAGAKMILFSSPSCQDLLAWFRRGSGQGWEIPSDTSHDYKEHLMSHKKMHRINKRTGKDSYEWIRVARRPDHLLDCETMLIAFSAFGKLIKAEVVVSDTSDNKKEPDVEYQIKEYETN
jgi:hypothetical protein